MKSRSSRHVGKTAQGTAPRTFTCTLCHVELEHDGSNRMQKLGEHYGAQHSLLIANLELTIAGVRNALVAELTEHMTDLTGRVP